MYDFREEARYLWPGRRGTLVTAEQVFVLHILIRSARENTYCEHIFFVYAASMASMAKKILLELPDDLAAALDRLREKEGETRLTVIRMLLKEALAARKAWPPKKG